MKSEAYYVITLSDTLLQKEDLTQGGRYLKIPLAEEEQQENAPCGTERILKMSIGLRLIIVFTANLLVFR